MEIFEISTSLKLVREIEPPFVKATLFLKVRLSNLREFPESVYIPVP